MVHALYLKTEVKVKVTQSCLTLCDPMDDTVHGILQARILKRVAFPFSRESPQPRDWSQVSLWASLMAQRLKCLPAMQETWVRSLGREDPLEKEMATHSSILAWRIPWTEEPGGLHSPRGRKESDTTERLHFHFHSLIAGGFFTNWASREAPQWFLIEVLLFGL